MKVSAQTGGQWLWRGVGQPALPEGDPEVAFARLFGDLVGADPDEVARQRAHRDAVLDAVQRQFDLVTPRLGAEDRLRVEAHQGALEEVRSALQGAALGESCAPPALGAVGSSYPAISAAHAQLLAMAFACDQTRVGALTFGDLNAFPWLDADFASGWHDAVHAGPAASATARADLIASYAWFAEQLALLLDALDAVPEGDGTLLDHTLVLFANCFSDGSAHSHTGKSYLLAGGGPGLQMGRALDAGGAPHGELLTAVLQAVGFDVDHFGDRDFCDRAPGMWA